MKRHVIFGRFGIKDKFTVGKRRDEISTELKLFTAKEKLNYGMDGALEELLAKGVFPSEIATDLLIFAAHVHAADTRISRDTESQDSWTREIRLVVPVSDVARWKKAGPTLKRTLDFLSGDIWTLDFRPRPKGLSHLVPRSSLPLIAPPFDVVSLFSGGLDSLVGAIDTLEEGRKPLFVSHAGDPATSKAQQDCFNQLSQKYSRQAPERLRVWMTMDDVTLRGDIAETTTRARSFLFFSLGIFAGSGLRKSFELLVPENGLIALNVPLDPLRLGSHSTRTTHPFYIARWNEILHILGIPGEISNPCWNKTKGEMVKECKNQRLLKSLIPVSLSCSSPTKARWKGHRSQHCGYCLPCLIRRAAVQSGFGSSGDATKYTAKNLKRKSLNPVIAEGQQIRSFQFALNRMRQRPASVRYLVFSSGSLADESQDRQTQLVDVYRRRMLEVGKILTGVKTRPR